MDDRVVPGAVDQGAHKRSGILLDDNELKVLAGLPLERAHEPGGLVIGSLCRNDERHDWGNLRHVESSALPVGPGRHTSLRCPVERIYIEIGARSRVCV